MQQPPTVEGESAARRSLFRALHDAHPLTRRALLLVAKGHSVEHIGRLLGCHPRLLERRLRAFADGIASPRTA